MTSLSSRNIRSWIYFYSHAREGRDFPELSFVSVVPSISTHTPARGVTISGRERNGRSTHFYSHAREGRDNEVTSWENILATISTHTPARGVTLRKEVIQGECNDFYSHAREGRDPTLAACYRTI